MQNNQITFYILNPNLCIPFSTKSNLLKSVIFDVNILRSTFDILEGFIELKFDTCFEYMFYFDWERDLRLFVFDVNVFESLFQNVLRFVF